MQNITSKKYGKYTANIFNKLRESKHIADFQRANYNKGYFQVRFLSNKKQYLLFKNNKSFL